MRASIHTQSTHTQFKRRNIGPPQAISLIFIVCVLFLVSHRRATAQTVHIPDPNLRAALELALRKEEGADITQADMASLEVLQASKCRFLRRRGVPKWIPLWRRCRDNRFESNIQDLTGLEFAINLKELHLAHNQISDVSALKTLTKLIVLDLHNNFRISDVFPLSTLTNLTHLSLWGNKISDASPLSTLTNLIYLSLEGNQISDVSPLSVLTNLIGLDIEANQITDLSPLKILTGLIYLDFDDNRVSDVTPLKNMTKLIQLDGSDNQISDLSPLRALTRLRQLDLDDNQITDVFPLKDMRWLTLLDLDGNQITDVSPLKDMVSMRRLNLDDNKIMDVTPLKDMRRLEKLDLDHNQIADVTPLKDMTWLTWLDLDDNQISNVSALRNMTKLRLLDLGDNQIFDVTPLKDMINLTELDLNDNEISVVTPLKNMIQLTVLDLDGNEISDVSPLKNMTKLTMLDLRDNHISDFSPIAGLIENLVEYDNSDQTAPSPQATDVNRDGVVNIIDLVSVASNYQNPDFVDFADSRIYPDVNGDGVVDVLDLIAVAGEIDVAAAPTLGKNTTETPNLTAENLKRWIQLAKQFGTQEPRTQKGITVLEQLLAILNFTNVLPQETALLTNYPNPFNPETWIPYQLAEPATVNISIYAADGRLVRTLVLGHLAAGVYHSKSRAAYWDGRNELGEVVASGVYFYTLTADDFTTTGKMLIRK